MDAFLRAKLVELSQAGRFPHAILLISSNPRVLEANAEACAKLLLSRENLTACANYSEVRPSGKMDQISIDDIRELTHRLGQSAFGPGPKLAIIHGADRMQRFAANALLKFLEEPPDGTIFFLCTRRLYEVLPTIRSRCIAYRLRVNDTMENADEKWKEWLTRWQLLIQSADENPRDELWCEAYALVHNFRVLLEEMQSDGGEPGENGDNSGRRPWVEAKLGDCARALYETSLATIPRDAFERRKAVVILARRMEAIGTAAALLRLNYGEVAAVEFFITSLFRQNYSHGHEANGTRRNLQ
jgi:DNA polymerase-3 subunit delta'